MPVSSWVDRFYAERTCGVGGGYARLLGVLAYDRHRALAMTAPRWSRTSPANVPLLGLRKNLRARSQKYGRDSPLDRISTLLRLRR